MKTRGSLVHSDDGDRRHGRLTHKLLTRLRARDRTAWEELYVEYQPRLRGFAYRLAGNEHDADDLVQETFVRAVPRLDKLDPETRRHRRLPVRHRAEPLPEAGRAGQRRQQPVAEVPEPALPTPIEDDPVRSTLLGPAAAGRGAARERPSSSRASGSCSRYGSSMDRSYAEISELVGMKENAVAQLIFRARESLRTELRLLPAERP